VADLVQIARLDDQISSGANAAAAAMSKLADAGDKVNVSVQKAGASAATLANRFDPATKAAVVAWR
jgi:hypothetical protein